MKRWVGRHPLLAVTAPAVLALVLGLLISPLVVSPQQAAVDSAAPPPTTLTASVTRGTVRQSLPMDATLTPESILTVTPVAPEDGSSAVYSALHVGKATEVQAGDVLFEVGGRPTFVLQGNMVSYRSLVPGSEGDDVTQLQAALRALGYEISAQESTFGASTGEAVTAFYEDRGFTAQRMGDEDVQAAAESLEQAERAVQSAQTSLERAERDLQEGREAHEKDPSVPEPTLDAVEDADLALEYAREDRETAETALAEARGKAGPVVPLGEVVHVAALPATVADHSIAVGQPVGESTITLSSGALTVLGTIQVGGEQVTADLPCAIIMRDGQSSDCTVDRVRQVPSQDGGQPATEVRAMPSTEINKDLRGEIVRLVIRLTESEEESLMVPESAVVTSAGGSTTVRVEESEGTLRDVEVALGATGDGYVEVAPIGDGDLAEGDQVVIGEAR